MVRPLGALLWKNRDLVGRKYAFLVTLTVMGFGTFSHRPDAALSHGRFGFAPLL